MGEIADMMIEGVLCQICGEYQGEGGGFPVTCGGCSGDTMNGGAHSKASKKERNLEWSTNHLIELGIEFTSHNNGIHLKVKRPAGIVDFWPSTGRFKHPNGSYGRGVKNMLKETEQNNF